MLTVKVDDSVKPRIYDIIRSESEDYYGNGGRCGINFVVPESVKASVEREVIKHRIDRCSSVRISEGEDKTIANINASLIDGDVLSFIRLGVRILEMSGTAYCGASGDLILRNVIYRILVEHKDEFIIISRLAGRLEYVDMIINLLQDLVRYNIRHPQIEKAYNLAKNEQSPYSDKLHDLVVLTGYIDEYNKKYGYKLLVSIISQADGVLLNLLTNPEAKDKFDNYELVNFLRGRFVLIGFGIDRLLTPEELLFVEHLSRLGADVRLYPLSDGSSEPEDGYKIYYYGNKLLNSITDKLEATIDDITAETADSDLDMNTLGGIVENYIFEKETPEIKDIDDLICTEIKGIDDRISYVANEIIDLTRNKGYRYKDIRIVCVNDDLIPRMKSILAVFGLEGFIDQRIPLNNTPVLRYVQELVHLPLRNYDLADVLALMRTSFLMIPPELIDLFENYAIEYNLTWGNRIFDEKYYSHENERGKTIKLGEKFYSVGHLGKFIWDKVVIKYLMPVYALCQSIINAKTISGKSAVLAEEIDSKRYLVEKLRDELIERKDTDGASALVMGYKEIMSLLIGFTDEINNVNISLDNFDTLLRIDMGRKSAGSIPLKVDSIEITNPRMCFLTPCKVMFVIGADESNFPYGKTNDSLLNSKELQKLFESAEVEFHEKAENKNRQDYITCSLMLNSVSDKLYFVHEFGKAESSVYTYLKSFVSEDKVNYNCFNSPVYGTPVVRRHEFDKASISEATMKKLLPEESIISVSALEEYNICHMRYMLDKVLRVLPRNDGTRIEYNEIGLLAHGMLENMFRRVRDVSDGDKERFGNVVSEYTADSELLSDLIDESYDYALNECRHPDKNTDIYSVSQGDKVKRIVKKAFTDLLNECSELDYLPDKFEYRLKDAEKGIEITTDNNTKFIFKGTIDRVDARFDNPKAVRIVDYKTGPKNLDYKKLVQGTQIQLFTYANALVRNGYSVENVGYAPIGLGSDEGETLRVSVQGIKFGTKNGEIKVEDVTDAIKYTDVLLKEGCNSIANGASEAKSEYKNANCCEYCNYCGICGNSITEPASQDSKLKLPKKHTLQAKDYFEAIHARLEEGEN
ncbi:MAG: PD-(D/E)XK nuclease family protein [Clostridia bacterium]|nr:PD-(D/E)XK nuclease family protein [Clostridia bacterium]